MKYILIILVGIIFAGCCSLKVPYTNKVRDELGLNTEESLRKFQFSTSTKIIFEKNTLITSYNKHQDRIIIPSGTKCVFDSYGKNGELILRFEVDTTKTITFGMRDSFKSDKFYLLGEERKGLVSYGNEFYTATESSQKAFLMLRIF